jgi:hypothetical protein
MSNFINIINTAKITHKTSVHPILSLFVSINKKAKSGLKNQLKSRLKVSNIAYKNTIFGGV